MKQVSGAHKASMGKRGRPLQDGDILLACLMGLVAWRGALAGVVRASSTGLTPDACPFAVGSFASLCSTGDQLHGWHRQRNGQGAKGDGRREGKSGSCARRMVAGEDGLNGRLNSPLPFQSSLPCLARAGQLAKVMDQFEKQFEDTDVRCGVTNHSIWGDPKNKSIGFSYFLTDRHPFNDHTHLLAFFPGPPTWRGPSPVPRPVPPRRSKSTA